MFDAVKNDSELDRVSGPGMTPDHKAQLVQDGSHLLLGTPAFSAISSRIWPLFIGFFGTADFLPMMVHLQGVGD